MAATHAELSSVLQKSDLVSAKPDRLTNCANVRRPTTNSDTSLRLRLRRYSAGMAAHHSFTAWHFLTDVLTSTTRHDTRARMWPQERGGGQGTTWGGEGEKPLNHDEKKLVIVCHFYPLFFLSLSLTPNHECEIVDLNKRRETLGCRNDSTRHTSSQSAEN